MNWATFFEKESNKEYFIKLQHYLQQERQQRHIFPEPIHVYRAFDETPFDKLKVVILGQDPYHGQGQAEGLSFSVKPGTKLPASLRNIFKELTDDLDINHPQNGSLIHWAQQGVFLLNTTLTVAEKSPASHSKIGWQYFTDNTIQFINDKKDNVVFILWGKHAQSKTSLIDLNRHHVIQSPHPSPFSARKGFFGSKPFSTTNQFLIQNNCSPIDWRL